MTSHLSLGPTSWVKKGSNAGGVGFRCTSPRLPAQQRAQTPPPTLALQKWVRPSANVKGSAAFVQTSERIPFAKPTDLNGSTMPLNSWVKRGGQPLASFRSTTPRLYLYQVAKANTTPPSVAPLAKWGPADKRPSASYASTSNRFPEKNAAASAECTAPLASWKTNTPASASFKMTSQRTGVLVPPGAAQGPVCTAPLANWTKRTGQIGRPSAGMLSTTPRHSYIPKKDPNV